MSSEKTTREYNRWVSNVLDQELLDELKAMDSTAIEDAFYCDLSFGTGGLRGVIGAGTNRMNLYTVAKASQGLADYILKRYKNPSIAVSDVRHHEGVARRYYRYRRNACRIL